MLRRKSTKEIRRAKSRRNRLEQSSFSSLTDPAISKLVAQENAKIKKLEDQRKKR